MALFAGHELPVGTAVPELAATNSVGMLVPPLPPLECQRMGVNNRDGGRSEVTMNTPSNNTTTFSEDPSPLRVDCSGPPAVPVALSRSLSDLACAIGNRMQCDVCSIYRLDRLRQSLILTATVGLRQSCIERLRMNIAEGLCGLVVQQRQPLHISEGASEHPRFKFFPEAGEDPYESFLGVPLTNGGTIVGVLVVQTIEPRIFTDEEVRALEQSGCEIGPLLEQLQQHDAL